MSTKIEWTDTVWNPVTGCTPVSEGCAHCYAASIAKRFWGDPKFSDVQFHEDRLNEPLRWKKPRMVFVNSMSDLFHEKVTDDQIDKAYAVIGSKREHVFQVLTKRPERALEYMRQPYMPGRICDVAQVMGIPIVSVDYKEHGDGTYTKLTPPPWPFPNLWLGCTCENQEWADKRIPILLKIPAAVRFISFEPLLSHVGMAYLFPSANGMHNDTFWVIVGPETGQCRRPCDNVWIKSVVDQCHDAGVPVFVKAVTWNGKTNADIGVISHVLGYSPDRLRQWPEVKL